MVADFFARHGRSSSIVSHRDVRRDARIARAATACAKAIEQLESRRLLSYTFALTGQAATVSPVASTGGPILIDEVVVTGNPVLEWSQDNGGTFSADWDDATAGTQTLPATTGSSITLTPTTGAGSSIILGDLSSAASNIFALFHLDNPAPPSVPANNSLTIDDRASTHAGGSYDFYPTLGNIAGPGGTSGGINYTSFGPINSYTIEGGPAANTYNIHSTFNTTTASTTIVGGAAGDTANVLGDVSPGIGNPLKIDMGGSANTVHVGNGNVAATVTAAVTVNDTGGTTTLDLDDTNDTASATTTVTSSSVQIGSAGIVKYSAGVTALNINGGASAGGAAGVTYNVNSTQADTTTTITAGVKSDTFNVTPSSNENSPITINGGDPVPPASPGDTLTVNIPSGTTGTTLSDTSDATGHKGQYTFDNLQPVNYTTIETLTTVADLAITVTGPAQPATEGGMLVYSVSIQNNGGVDATDVALSDILPDDLSFSFAGFSQGDPVNTVGQTVSDNLGTIPAGATVTGSIIAQALEFGIVTNTVSVMTDAVEANTANNSSSATTTVVDALLSPINGTTINAVKGKSFTGVVGGFTDGNPNPDLSDFSATIDWGDGTTSAGTIVVGAPGFSVTGTHTYSSTGNNIPVTITVQDIGGSKATIYSLANVSTASSPPPPAPSGSATTVTDPTDSSKTALKIIGTDNKDTITVIKSGSSQGKATVKINGVNKGTFNFSGIVLVYGNGGSDSISIDSGITRSAWMWGGDGNDTVNDGGGNDIIFGQGNDDSLNGNVGRDILVGGDGTDKLNGGSGDDLLIAGDFKSVPSMSQLSSIQKEWSRTDKNYSARVKDLTNGGGFNSIKLNNSTLFSSTTLKDSLTGGADSDLFFIASTGDKITDKASGETTVNVG